MRAPNKRQTFWLLMAAAIVMRCLPDSYSSPLHGLFDPVLGPLTGWLHAAGHGLRDKAAALTAKPQDIPAVRDLEAKLAERDREAAALRLQSQKMEELLAQATGLRKDLLLPRGRLVPAEVLNRDAVGWRESFLIDQGRNVKIDRKQWVGGGVRTFIDRGKDSELAEGHWTVLPLSSPAGQRTFLRNALIGRVEQVGQVTARVRLLTDPDSHVGGQLYDPVKNRLGPNCRVDGVGPGQLQVDTVAWPPVRAGELNRNEPPAKEGDLILSAADTPGLPGQLLIGRVTAVRQREDRPVEYQLQIAPAVDYSRLTRLFVIDPAGGPPGREGR